MRPAALLALAVLLAAGPAWAYFEQTDVDARSVALGPSAMATVNDVSAYHWNPAALATLSRAQVMFDWSAPWAVDNLSENTLAAGTSRWHTGFAAAWHRLGIPDVYAEDQFCLAAGRTVLRPRGAGVIDAGATYKFERIAFQPFDVSGTSYALGAMAKGDFDLGARWRTPWRTDISWVMRNALQPRFELVGGSGGNLQLPRQELAAAFHWNHESTISVGWAQQPNNSSTLSSGIEILFFNVFAVRSGMKNLATIYAAQHQATLSDPAYHFPNDLQFTGGVGVFHKGYYVDAAAETSHDLGASYRATLTVPFGRERAR